MNDQILKDILRRLKALEQTAVRYRAGEVTDIAPLDVALGGSDVSYEDVQAVGPITDGAQVATLLWGNDLLVLGDLNGGIRFGTGSIAFTASTNSATTTIAHGLGHTPIVVLALPFSSPAFGKIPSLNLSSSDATNIVINGEVDTAHTGSISFSWLVI